MKKTNALFVCLLTLISSDCFATVTGSYNGNDGSATCAFNDPAATVTVYRAKANSNSVYPDASHLFSESDADSSYSETGGFCPNGYSRCHKVQFVNGCYQTGAQSLASGNGNEIRKFHSGPAPSFSPTSASQVFYLICSEGPTQNNPAGTFMKIGGGYARYACSRGCQAGKSLCNSCESSANGLTTSCGDSASSVNYTNGCYAAGAAHGSGAVGAGDELRTYSCGKIQNGISIANICGNNNFSIYVKTERCNCVNGACTRPTVKPTKN